MNVTFHPLTGFSCGWVQGKPGPRRYLEEFNKGNGYRKDSKASSSEKGIIFRGGPWNGGKYSRQTTFNKGQRGKARKVTLEHPAVYFASECDGYYLYRPEYDDYYWHNPKEPNDNHQSAADISSDLLR